MSFFGIFEDLRSLTQDEKDLAKKVYETFLPYGEIFIGNKTGFGGAPFTEHCYNSDEDAHTYILHMGPIGFTSCSSLAEMGGFGMVKVVFIHELCHVWQGHHSQIKGGFMAKSIYAQLKSIVRTGDRNNAYTYTAGQAWDSYNVEQQANIVEDWFKNGQSKTDDLFRYIRDNIRK
jgi:hypothetical protein